MRYKGDDYYSMGTDFTNRHHEYAYDLAELLMNTDTNEGLVKNILQLYKSVGQPFGAGEDLIEDNTHPQLLMHTDAYGVLLDKLIEISYKIHKDKRRRGGKGYFIPHWLTQPELKDDIDFEHYLTNLQSECS